VLVLFLIRVEDLPDIATGAAILGTGGGGDPYRGMLMAQGEIRQRGPVQIIRPDELGDDDLVIPVGGMGAPTVGMEKIDAGPEMAGAFQALERYLGKKASAVMGMEVGGGNSTHPIRVAAQLGLPVVDADGMGRAFPELQMVTPGIYGISATPIALVDTFGNAVVFETVDNHWAEKLARSAVVQMGCRGAVALYPLTGKQVKETTVHDSLTLARRIGAAIREARATRRDPAEAVLAVTGGCKLFRAKVTDVQRETRAGFARGGAHLEGFGTDEGRHFLIEFQNENLVALEGEKVLCSVPDLICNLDAETGEPITTENLRYGFRIQSIAIPCNPHWRTPGGIRLAGPRAFGYGFEFIPVEELQADQGGRQ
jgi:DUF917 family protein